MDVSPYLEPKPAPHAIFDRLPERATRVRYMVPEGGDYQAVTWAAHARDIRRLALFLSAELKPSETAAIFAPNRVEWMTAAMAIESAGAILIPIYPSSTAEQAAYVIDHGDTKVLFADTVPVVEKIFERWSELESVRRFVLLGEIDLGAVLERVKERTGAAPPRGDVERRVIDLDRALTLGAARDREDPAAFERMLSSVSLEQPAIMLYTSGTSGRPKGVPLTHRNVASNGADWFRAFAPILEEGAVDLLWLPMSHIFGFGEACIGNALGWTTYLSDPVHVCSALPAVRPSVFMSVPSVWEKLASVSMAEPTQAKQHGKLAALTGGSLRFCLSGGAGLARDVKSFYHDAGILVLEGYGLTECAPTLTLNRPDAFRFDSVGKPLASVELCLAEDGEILARGPNVFAGYHKDASATKDAFTEAGWFKTGDIGRFTDDGFLQIVDRKKDILVTAGGKNVPPANIELLFLHDPLITRLVVYGDGKKYLVAGVWLEEAAVKAHFAAQHAEDTPEARRALVSRRIERVSASLASFETIKSFAIIDEPLTVESGLLTPTLKVKRKAVYERFRDVFEGLYA